MFHQAGRDRQISLEGYAYQPKLTPNGKILCYRILRGSQAYTDATELWSADLDSGHNERLLPGFKMFGSSMYDISEDGSQVVVAARDRDGKDRLWLAPLDRRSPPRQIPNVEGNWVIFGQPGEIIFRSVDGFAYRVHEDGTGLKKVIEEPVDRIYSSSPDHHWLVVERGQTFVYPLEGGPPVQVGGDIPLKWSRDGKHLYISLATSGMGVQSAGKTYVVPLPPGRMLPDIPPSDFSSAADLAKFPGVRIIDAADVAPGATPDVYAFSLEKTQRNLFRIPIP